MRIRRLRISNFRGIRNLDWCIPADKKLICLIGAGDTGKTTVLVAIDWLLGSRWNIPICESDYFEKDAPIEIEALIDDLPAEYLGIDKYGCCLCGVGATGEKSEEPDETHEECIHVLLRIDGEMEPAWCTANPNGEEGKFSPSSRRNLGVAMLDDQVDVHMRWTKTSSLGRLINRDPCSGNVLRAASRAATEALHDMELPSGVKDSLDGIRKGSMALGAAEYEELLPGIDDGIPSRGGIALYSGDIPLTSYGLGTRRLTSLAIQRQCASNKSTLLVDEVESGLEPHRVVALVDALNSDPGIAQAFITTHSAAVVEYCSWENIAVANRNAGDCRISFVGNKLQAMLRTSPSAFLARRVLVVEGKTEEGICRVLLEKWDEGMRASGRLVSSGYGFALCQGGGGALACEKAEELQSLGYEVALLVDNDDESIRKRVADLGTNGVRVITWSEGMDTEHMATSLMCLRTLLGLLTFVSTDMDEEIVLRDLHSNGLSAATTDFELAHWENQNLEHARKVVADAATRKDLPGKDRGRKSWFKSVERGKALGEWLLGNDPGGLVEIVRNELKSFVYRESVPNDD